MSELLKADKTYAKCVSELKVRHRQSRVRAFMVTDSHQLAFNWSVGRDIVALQFKNTYDALLGNRPQLVDDLGLDKVEAQYALESSSRPVGMLSYEVSKLIPEDFKGSLPMIEEIEAELGGVQ